MNKFILLTLVFLPVIAFPQDAETPVLTTKVENDELFNPRKGHWLTSFGFETIKYEVPFQYEGARQSFAPGKQELWGGRLGVGREFYLGAGFNTTTKLEGFYMGTLFERSINAAPEEASVEYAYTKKTGHIYGAVVAQSIGYLFDMKTKNPLLDEMTYLTVEPFVEFGIGRARAYNRRNYNFDTGAGNVQEMYRLRVEDEIATQHFGGGVNFTSRAGYFLYLKATQYTMNVIERNYNGISRPNGQAATEINRTDKNVDMDPVTVYAIGGGYKF